MLRMPADAEVKKRLILCVAAVVAHTNETVQQTRLGVSDEGRGHKGYTWPWLDKTLKTQVSKI